MAGADKERQERGVLNAVNNSIKKSPSRIITVSAGNYTIDGVTRADKKSQGGMSNEPYTDVVLYTKTKTWNLSLKGESAPSLAGGGLSGLEAIIPGITYKFMMKTKIHLISTKLRPGSKVPDVYGKISPADKLKIVVGNAAMGGPIHYMYIGPMDVISNYNKDNNILQLNGNLTPVSYYAKTHELYFRLRARREDQTFDPLSVDSRGAPKIYSKSPSKGDSAGRIVVTDYVPSNAVIIKL